MRYLRYFIWLAMLALGVLCIGLFIQGLVRDTRLGDPDLSVDLSQPSRTHHDFRLWRGGEYDLAVSSVNHVPPFKVPFTGSMNVVLTDADGRELINRILDSSSAHMRPDNMSWSLLDSLMLSRRIVGQMRLSAVVGTGDQQFRGVTTTVHLRRRQYDPGMGGLVNYVVLLPGIIFMVLSGAAGLSVLQHGGSRAPLLITIALSVLLAGVALILR